MGKPRTSKKKFYNAPLHKRREHVSVHLSKEAKSKLKTTARAIPVKKGDKVKVMRGKFKGKEGTVLRVSYVYRRVYVEGITQKTARGDDKLMPLEPSNLMIIDPVEEGRKKYIRGE